jgi:hypothetical protein
MKDDHVVSVVHYALASMVVIANQVDVRVFRAGTVGP